MSGPNSDQTRGQADDSYQKQFGCYEKCNGLSHSRHTQKERYWW